MVTQPNKLQCYVSLGPQIDDISLVETIRKSVHSAKMQLIQPLIPLQTFQTTPQKFQIRWHKNLAESIAKADCIIADVTRANPYVYFEIGYAEAFDKSIFLITRDAPKEMFEVIRDYPILKYDPADLKTFGNSLTNILTDQDNFSKRSRMPPAARTRGLFVVDWEMLTQEDTENLCLELLTQLGYRSVNWQTESDEIDIVAELPKKDPDGFEYRELWFVSMGRNSPSGLLLETLQHDPEYFFGQLFRLNRRMEAMIKRGGTPITVLFILSKDTPMQSELFNLEERLHHKSSASNLRVRIWTRNYLTSLIHQFPQIGFKYFSDEGRSKSKYRKTPEELFRENLELNKKLAELLVAMQDEKDKRTRAERDSVWKDISISAAHKIGNPIFAIETNLDPLEKRVSENRTTEALTVVSDIRRSVDKAKGIIEQFTSLNKALEFKPVAVKPNPLIDVICSLAKMNNVECEIECADLEIYADPARMAEVLDELTRNALRWLDKYPKQISITVQPRKNEVIPPPGNLKLDYAIMHFRDNGVGVPLENKSKIFDAFFTTHQHGTGIGLAVVRRIIEEHGGAIFESGIPGKGADFEIYLPLFTEKNLAQLVSIRDKVISEVNK
jgi:signal transduction histidine kinase